MRRLCRGYICIKWRFHQETTSMDIRAQYR